MKTLPSQTLMLCDLAGAPFGALRFVASEDNPTKGDCIFEITSSSSEQEAQPEVRWLYKRRYKRAGEHKFKLTEEGALTVSQASFRIVLIAHEDGDLIVKGPHPAVTGFWELND